jgi:hypothetical protein
LLLRMPLHKQVQRLLMPHQLLESNPGLYSQGRA